MAPICGPCLMSHMGLLIEPKDTPKEFSPVLPFWGHSDRPPHTKLGCDPPGHRHHSCAVFRSSRLLGLAGIVAVSSSTFTTVSMGVAKLAKLGASIFSTDRVVNPKVKTFRWHLYPRPSMYYVL